MSKECAKYEDVSVTGQKLFLTRVKEFFDIQGKDGSGVIGKNLPKVSAKRYVLEEETFALII